MRILHLIDIPWWSGLAAYAFDTIEAHTQLGHEVLIACESGTLPHQKAVQTGLPVRPIGGRKSIQSALNFFKIGSIISGFRPALIVAHTGSTHWIAWWWGKQKKVPVIRVRAISQRVRGTALNRRIYSESRWIVTGSEKLRNECIERWNPPLGNVIKMTPPVESPKHFESSAFKHHRVGMLARLDPIKGHAVVIKAAKLVQDTFPDAEFHFAGPEEGIRWHSLKKLADDLGVRNVLYHGFLPQGRIREFLGSCAAGVIASTGSEEIARAGLEWMSAGRPVVGTTVGCIPEIFEGENRHFLVPANNPEAMAQKIKELFTNPFIAKKVGRENYETAQQLFSRKNFRDQWGNLLDKLR